MWYSVRELADLLHLSTKTIRRKIKTSEWKTKEVHNPKGGAMLLIWYDSVLDNGEKSEQKKQVLDIGEKSKSDNPVLDNPVLDNSVLDNPVLDTGEKSTPSAESALSKTHDSRLTTYDSLLPAINSEQAFFLQAPVQDRKIALAKLNIVNKFNIFRQEQTFQNRPKANIDAAWDTANHKIVADELKTLSMSNVSNKTVKKWTKALRDAGFVKYPVALLPKDNASTASLPPIVLNAINDLIRDPNQHRNLAIHNCLLSDYPSQYNISYRSLCRLIQELKAQDKFISTVNGKVSYKNRAKPHIKRINDTIPGKVFCSDARQLDMFIRSNCPYHHNPAYRLIYRPWFLAFVDVATGLITGYSVGVAEDSHLVVSALNMSVRSWGVPDELYLDNGSAYQNYQLDPYYFLNHRIKGSQPYQKASELINAGEVGIYRKIGINKITYAIPNNPESKPIEPTWNFIFEDWERAHRTFSGKNPKDRPETIKDLSTKQLLKKFGHLIPTFEEFIGRINFLVEKWNNSPRPVLSDHNGSPHSPLDVFKNEADNITIPAMSYIEDALTMYKEVSVQRDGIYINGNWYYHPAHLAYVGQKVLVTYDEINYKSINLFTLSGQLIAHPAQILDYSCYSDKEQVATVIKDTRHREKVAIVNYSRIRKEFPGKYNQKNINQIISKPIDEIEYQQTKFSAAIKQNGFAKLPAPKASQLLPTTSGIKPEPEMSELILNVEIIPQHTDELTTLEKKVLKQIENCKDRRGL